MRGMGGTEGCVTDITKHPLWEGKDKFSQYVCQMVITLTKNNEIASSARKLASSAQVMNSYIALACLLIG